MEVMLEIYKTLQVLGMEWKKKDGIEFPDIGPPPAAGGYPSDIRGILLDQEELYGVKDIMGRPAPTKKEIVAREKAAQDLYLVQTRARYGAVMVSPVPLFGVFDTEIPRCGWIYNSTGSTARISSSISRISVTTKPPRPNSEMSPKPTLTHCRAVMDMPAHRVEEWMERV